MKTERKTLVVLDRLPGSDAFLRYAGRMAGLMDSRMFLLHIVEWRKRGYWQFVDRRLVGEKKVRCTQFMVRAKRILEDLGVPCDMDIREQRHEIHVDIVTMIRETPGIIHVILADKREDDRHMQSKFCLAEHVIHEISRNGMQVPVTVLPAEGPDSEPLAEPVPWKRGGEREQDAVAA